MGRPTNATVARRRALVREVMLQGHDVNDLRALTTKQGKPVFGTDVLERDVAAVRAGWAAHDQTWFDRAANARRIAEARYTDQLSRLHDALKEVIAQADGKPFPTGDVATIERAITIVIGRLHDVGREVDPADYLNKLRECYILTPSDSTGPPPKVVDSAGR